jgi:hypothetical protein
MWSDYLPPSFTSAFEEETGIKINFTGIGSNEELINRLRATQGEGYDICSPTNDRAPQWAELELLQPIDYGKVPLDRVNDAMARSASATGTSAARAPIGCRISGAPRASAGAPTCGTRRASSRAMATCGRRRMPARPWAGRTR